MSHQQKENFRLIKSLLLQLGDYGLNPYEWRIVRGSSAESVCIAHRLDHTFQLEGHVELSTLEGLKWRTITLASL